MLQLCVVCLKPKPKVEVRIFLHLSSETAVLVDPSFVAKIDDRIAVYVSNTSGGRDSLEVRTSRTLLMEKYDPHKPNKVIRTLQLVGK